MGTEVLRPQNCLVERIRSPSATAVGTGVFPPRRRTNNSNYYCYNYGNSNFNNHYSFTPRPNRKLPVRSDPQRRLQPRQSDATLSSSSSSFSLSAAAAAGFSKRSSSADDVKLSRNRSAAGDHLVMEKVTMLRRGESLDSRVKGIEKDSGVSGGEGLVVFAVTGTDRLGPENPGMLPKQIGIVTPAAGKPDVLYAGSAFAVSPAPSSLPLPSFSKKKSKSVSVDDSATRDLRRLLRLDL